jgi:hypothetical protein
LNPNGYARLPFSEKLLDQNDIFFGEQTIFIGEPYVF